MAEQMKSYHDYGLTDEDFREIVEFFWELLKLDQRGKERERFVRALHRYLQKQIAEERKRLQDEICRLESLRSKF